MLLQQSAADDLYAAEPDQEDPGLNPDPEALSTGLPARNERRSAAGELELGFADVAPVRSPPDGELKVRGSVACTEYRGRRFW